MGRRRALGNEKLEPGVYRHPKGGYRVKKTDGKFQYFGQSRYDDAVALARSVAAKKGSPDEIDTLIEQYIAELPIRTKNKQSTIDAKAYCLRMYARRWQGKSIRNVQHTTLQKVWDTMTDAAYQNHRKHWRQFGKWIVSKGWWELNRVDKTLWRGTERQKERHTPEGYAAIYEKADDWLRDAMDLAIYSLQDQTVLCDLLKSDAKDDRLVLTRYKTGANIALLMPEGTKLRTTVDRAIDRWTAGDTILRRVPSRRRPGKDWSAILPGYLSHQFTKVRNESGAYDHLPPALRPDYRALRSYGGWLYREAGYSDEYVRQLYQHRSLNLTQYYTESGYKPRYADAEAGL